jgi:5-methylcytosine-specific restriction endonuclease McrA
MTKAEQLKGISENKRQERQHERKKRNEPGSESVVTDNVTPLHQEPHKRKSFKLPSNLKDILNKGETDE